MHNHDDTVAFLKALGYTKIKGQNEPVYQRPGGTGRIPVGKDQENTLPEGTRKGISNMVGVSPIFLTDKSGLSKKQVLDLAKKGGVDGLNAFADNVRNGMSTDEALKAALAASQAEDPRKAVGQIVATLKGKKVRVNLEMNQDGSLALIDTKTGRIIADHVNPNDVYGGKNLDIDPPPEAATDDDKTKNFTIQNSAADTHPSIGKRGVPSVSLHGKPDVVVIGSPGIVINPKPDIKLGGHGQGLNSKEDIIVKGHKINIQHKDIKIAGNHIEPTPKPDAKVTGEKQASHGKDVHVSGQPDDSRILAVINSGQDTAKKPVGSASGSIAYPDAYGHDYSSVTHLTDKLGRKVTITTEADGEVVERVAGKTPYTIHQAQQPVGPMIYNEMPAHVSGPSIIEETDPSPQALNPSVAPSPSPTGPLPPPTVVNSMPAHVSGPTIIEDPTPPPPVSSNLVTLPSPTPDTAPPPPIGGLDAGAGHSGTRMVME